MKKKMFSFARNCFLPFVLILFITSCIHIEKGPIIKNVFVSKDIASYKIESLAVLPLMPDDSSNIGAYFATNFLYNIFYDDYPNVDIADLDWIRKFDNSIVDEEIQSLKAMKRFDLKIFENSDLGRNIIYEEYDAVLIGNIENIKYTEGLVFGTDAILRAWVTSCSFRYYIISLNDARVLWAASCQSDSYNYLDNYLLREYPPVDKAITNGLDEIVLTIPNEILFTNYIRENE